MKIIKAPAKINIVLRVLGRRTNGYHDLLMLNEKLDLVDEIKIDVIKIPNPKSQIPIRKIVPITYMNSHAELKAFCGRNGGLVCTSSNAGAAFEWAFKHGDKLFFFPDEHLGRNTARKMEISLAIWDPNNIETHKLINSQTRLVLWKGYCHVHTYFTLQHVNGARKKYPECKIIVHPECTEDVVMASDEAASTDGICKYVAAQPVGATIVIGTEINLVSRLAHENPDKNIVPLARSLCPNMFKISLEDLCNTLESLVANRPINEITVPPEIAKDARLALDRMLSI